MQKPTMIVLPVHEPGGMQLIVQSMDVDLMVRKLQALNYMDRRTLWRVVSNDRQFDFGDLSQELQDSFGNNDPNPATRTIDPATAVLIFSLIDSSNNSVINIHL